MSKIGTWVGVGVSIVAVAVSVTIPEVRRLVGLSATEIENVVEAPPPVQPVRLEREIHLASGIPVELLPDFFATYRGMPRQGVVWAAEDIGDLEIFSARAGKRWKFVIRAGQLETLPTPHGKLLFQVTEARPEHAKIK